MLLEDEILHFQRAFPWELEGFSLGASERVFPRERGHPARIRPCMVSSQTAMDFH